MGAVGVKVAVTTPTLALASGVLRIFGLFQKAE